MTIIRALALPVAMSQRPKPMSKIPWGQVARKVAHPRANMGHRVNTERNKINTEHKISMGGKASTGHTIGMGHKASMGHSKANTERAKPSMMGHSKASMEQLNPPSMEVNILCHKTRIVSLLKRERAWPLRRW